MHSINITQGQIAALWRALHQDLKKPEEAPLRRHFADIVKKGHVASYQIEDILYESGYDLSTGRETFEGLSAPSFTLFPRPGSRVTAAVGFRYNTAAEGAALLKMLERLGLAVDASPLVDALLPALRSKQYLTQAELEVWWFHKERHRMETVMVETERAAGPGKYHKFKTMTGYKVEASERGDRIEWLTVKAPKYRFRSGLIAA